MTPSKLNNQSGLTLIEVLISVAIMGILGAMAIPHFGTYRPLSFEAVIRNDLRNAAVAQEANTLTTDPAGFSEQP